MADHELVPGVRVGTFGAIGAGAVLMIRGLFGGPR
jgi:hypothetical protein